MRGTTNRNQRGSSLTRSRRKQWLLDTFGNGTTVMCKLRLSVCVGLLTFDTVTVDRIVPGCDGGTYRRENIQPACGPCNSKHGGGIRRMKEEEK